MQRTGRRANIAISSSYERNSAGLNWTELQQGHIRFGHSTRGSQLGQVMEPAFIWNFPPLDPPLALQSGSVSGV